MGFSTIVSQKMGSLLFRSSCYRGSAKLGSISSWLQIYTWKVLLNRSSRMAFFCNIHFFAHFWDLLASYWFSRSIHDDQKSLSQIQYPFIAISGSRSLKGPIVLQLIPVSFLPFATHTPFPTKFFEAQSQVPSLLHGRACWLHFSASYLISFRSSRPRARVRAQLGVAIYGLRYKCTLAAVSSLIKATYEAPHPLSSSGELEGLEEF